MWIYFKKERNLGKKRKYKIYKNRKNYLEESKKRRNPREETVNLL